MIELTQENYYDKETDYQYMSFSLYKNFMANPARALADMRDEYPWFKDNKALLVGNYLHSYFESEKAHKKFIEENKDELIGKSGKYKGCLKSDYQLAEKMIKRLEAEDDFNNLLFGTQREVIVQGNIDSVPWKGKVDALNVEKGYFIDFKTVKTLVNNGSEWVPEERVKKDFIRSRGYDKQMAIYAELLKQMYGKKFQPVIWAVSKEDEPLAKPFMLLPETLRTALSQVESHQEQVLKWINGEERAPLKNDASNFYNYSHRVENEDDYEKI